MQEASDGNIHVIRHGEVFVITLRGEVDHDDAPTFQQAWDAADRAMLPTTAVDLSQLVFGDSLLLSALLKAKHRHEADGRDLILVGPLQPAVHRLLDISGTLEYFTIADTGPAPNS
ncbi:STAS domain-containing protein [Streptomyces xanthochromogenes]|uniref:STAS domain-containing protein n=1 Tax=Streptomyces TaxID=1883 RepID=UPI0014229E7C